MLIHVCHYLPDTQSNELFLLFLKRSFQVESMKMKMEIDSEVKKRQSMQVKDLRKSILDLEKMEIEGSPDTDKKIDIRDPVARKRSTR